MKRAPDRRRALDLYRRHARNYDRSSWVTLPYRRRAVALLSLTQGDTVLVPSLWAFPLLPLVWLIGRRYVTTYEGIQRRWDLLERWVDGLRVRTALLGIVYFAWGNVRDHV
jgi:hypothetical protein